ncbi:hypothetical protein Tco_1012011, partial [Tanacetum coccineum]
MEKLARTYLKEVVARHEIPVLIICDRDPRFTSLMDEVHITSPTSTTHVPPPKVQPVLMDALTQIPKFTKVLKDLLKDKEKLEELANTPINVECSAILLNKVPEKLEDPVKFLIPCILQDLKVYNSLADSGASINLMPLQSKRSGPFLRTARALVDLYEEKLTLRVGNEEVISPLVETSDSLLEEFADELALLDPFPLENEDDNFDHEADLREIKYLLNRDPYTVSSPTTDIDIVDPVLERFTGEPALIYSYPPGDDDDDLFDFKTDNDEWKKLLYGDSYNDTHSENDKTKDSKTKSLIDEANIVESNVLPPQLLTSNSTLPEESSESSDITTLLSSPFKNEDKIPSGESGGPAVVNGGSPPLTTAVDNCWPPLTAAVDRWIDGGAGDSDGTVPTPRGTTQVVTRGYLMINCRSKWRLRGTVHQMGQYE